MQYFNVKISDNSNTEQGQCPCCGRCLSCGQLIQKEIVYVPYVPYTPYVPYAPYPVYPTVPFEVTC